MVSVTSVPIFEDNYVWLIADTSAPPHERVGVLIDPGDAKPVIEALERLQIRLLAILITHRHHDHVDGVAALVKCYASRVFGPASEQIPNLEYPLREGDHVNLGATLPPFQVLDVPGHTSGHIAYFGGGNLFCGDTLFTGGCGRLEGRAEQMHHSLNKIAALPNSTRVYCAHEYTLANLRFALKVEPDNIDLQARWQETIRLRGDNQPTVPSTLDLEKRTNPFLRCHVPAVIAAAQHYSGKQLDSSAAVFEAVRSWKDDQD